MSRASSGNGRPSASAARRRRKPTAATTVQADPPTLAEAPGDELSSLFARLLKHPAARYLLIAPTALSALANLEPIGSLAKSIVSLWRPVVDAIANGMDQLMPQSPVPGEMLVAALFFLPFPVARVIAMARGGERQTPAWLAILGLLAFAALFVLVGGAEQPDSDSVIVAATFTLPILAAYALLRLVFHLVKPLHTWTTLAMPLASLLAVGVMATVVWLRGETGASPLQIALLVAVWALPLLNPKRLLQVAALAFGVVGISLTYDWLGSLAA